MSDKPQTTSGYEQVRDCPDALERTHTTTFEQWRDDTTSITRAIEDARPVIGDQRVQDAFDAFQRVRTHFVTDINVGHKTE